MTTKPQKEEPLDHSGAHGAEHAEADVAGPRAHLRRPRDEHERDGTRAGVQL